MLFVYYGNEVLTVRDRAQTLLSKYEKEGFLSHHILPMEYEIGVLRDGAEAASLFSEKQVVLIDTLSEKEEAYNDMLASAEAMAGSEHVFIVLEATLGAEAKKVLKKHAAEISESKAEKKQSFDSFNAFSLADALLRRDKKSLWMLLVRAEKDGVPPEQSVGMLYWQLKVLQLTEASHSATEAGQKEFVYQKAKRALQKFKKGEVGHHARTLLTLYHEAHLGRGGMYSALERWALRL